MTNAKKTHWLRTTLIVLIACGVAGTILAVILFNAENNRTGASASLQFSFSRAAEGKAPNGLPFDTRDLYSDEVLNNALAAAGLDGTYTADQLRANLQVVGVFPDRIVDQMTAYVSLLASAGNNTATVKDFHATQYSVQLFNDFDKSISEKQLTGLLREILNAYRQDFAETYSARLANTSPLTDLDTYDYAQQLDAITQSGNQLSRYAAEMQALAPDFRTDRKGFGDIVARYQNLSNDLDRVDAAVMINAVSVNRTRLQQRYEMEIRTLTQQLESLKEERAQIEARMNAYKKEGIIYVSSNGTLSAVGSNADETYDTLVQWRKSVSDTIADKSASLSLYNIRLAAITGENQAAGTGEEGTEEAAEEVDVLTKEELAELEEKVKANIQAILEKKAGIDAEFKAMLDAYSAREINEKTVSVSKLKYDAPTVLSGAFLAKLIKTAGPFCAVGFMVCMILIIISRRREEKAGQ